MSIFLATQGSIGGSISELNPSLIAVTITDLEIDKSYDFHSRYWVYNAEVEATIAGPEYNGEIKFAIAKATDLRRVFPAQFVLIYEGDSEYLEERFGTVMEAISMHKAEETVCFRLDLAEVFPDDARFASKLGDAESSDGNCYESRDLLRGNYP